MKFSSLRAATLRNTWKAVGPVPNFVLPKTIRTPTAFLSLNMIYFAAAPKSNEVKIGFSKDPERRIREINYQTVSLAAEHEFDLLTCVPGNMADEREFQKHFESRRIRGEWFFFCLETIALIKNAKTIADIPKDCPDFNCEDCPNW